MKRITAKILAFILIAAQLLFLVSCDTNIDDPTQTTAATTAETTAAQTTASETTAEQTTPEETTPEETTPEATTPEATVPQQTTPAPIEPSQPAQKSEIKNIIIIIGDGMGLEHIAAAQIYTGKTFEFTKWQQTSVNTNSLGTNSEYLSAEFTTDSAASGTALATGQLTRNRYVGKDSRGFDLPTILDNAAELNKSTGIVTTDYLYGATPAAFSAHTKNRDSYTSIITSQLSSGVTLLCGNRDESYCVSRKDDIEAAGYTLCEEYLDVDSYMSADKAYWQFDLYDARLAGTTKKALDYLGQDEDGFVLMVEQAHIDKYSHNNRIDDVIRAMQSLNKTVDTVLEWIGDRTDTAVIVTADHETGGLFVSAQEDVLPGKYGDLYYAWTSGDHTNSKVGLFVYGVEVDFSKYSYYSFSHVVKNTDVYNLAYDILKKQVS